ncbi:hypothetical protein BTT_59380 (plasmid) [Bacillus thuringiensis serovar morrisoni str. 4AA1]|uniref:Uncharacterized protein n=1 Tax=Bacillus cereus TIAC219 TaxID=718222 RepID=A0ABC9SRY3_BACCE|nr:MULTISPECIES: hypothetical protein [Bacillus]MCU5120108.1 hypothetical protein [Bacillus cereus]EJP82961.1 hypothetical protein IC1_05732 [Bacillus cereus VD022]EOQ58643.1 hypothetical protein IAY_05846 [Bacillus cereus TIAC219]MCU5633106.1 hypothetical protein [Bacillus cereus]MED3102205.1 hypothetical protein [Bacillus thuringiensis]
MFSKKEKNIQCDVIKNLDEVFLFPAKLSNHFYLMIPRESPGSDKDYFLKFDLYFDSQNKMLHIFHDGAPGYYTEGSVGLFQRLCGFIIESICLKLNIDDPKEMLVPLYFYDRGIGKIVYLVFGYNKSLKQYEQTDIELNEEEEYKFFLNQQELIRDQFKFN